jgi:hypothetical protein
MNGVGWLCVRVCVCVCKWGDGKRGRVKQPFFLLPMMQMPGKHVRQLERFFLRHAKGSNYCHFLFSIKKEKKESCAISFGLLDM